MTPREKETLKVKPGETVTTELNAACSPASGRKTSVGTGGAESTKQQARAGITRHQTPQQPHTTTALTSTKHRTGKDVRTVLSLDSIACGVGGRHSPSAVLQPHYQLPRSMWSADANDDHKLKPGNNSGDGLRHGNHAVTCHNTTQCPPSVDDTELGNPKTALKIYAVGT